MGREETGIRLFEDTLEIILVFEKNGQITYANTAAKKCLGYEEGMEGIGIEAVFPNVFGKNANLTESLPDSEGGLCKWTAYRKNQTCFPVEAGIHWSESLQSYICMADDVLEKEYLKKELEQVKQEAAAALQVKSEFVANVTHELRTPVNGVLGNVKELLGEETDEKKLRTLRMIERCCEDMNRLINNILDFSKLEAGKLVLESRRFHFRNMIDYVKATHQRLILEKGLEFFVTVSPGVPEYVVGDELRIVQILNNLLSNARKFTSTGKIALEVIKTAQMQNRMELFFLVSDTGIGISKQDQDKLFQSFSQVDASISRKFGGTGLGLNVSKQLVELMDGSISVESRENQGSVFRFSIWVDGEGGEETEDEIPPITFWTGTAADSGNSKIQPDESKIYGTEKNKEALEQILMKLVLSIEMDNWEKAEMFMESVRQLIQGAPQETGRTVLRLKMAIQKEDYDKSMTGLEELKKLLETEETVKKENIVKQEDTGNG